MPTRSPVSCRILLLAAAVFTAVAGCVAPRVLPDNEPVTLSGDTRHPTTGIDDPPTTYTDGPTPIPATVRHLEREVRHLSLIEAMALALETGYIGAASPNNPGNAIDDLASFNGASISGTDSIRVLALEPAIAGAAVDASLARFDVQSFANMTWKTFDEPTQGLNSFTNGQNANLTFGLAKPLPSGGVAGLQWNTDYSNLNNPPSSVILNPSYFTRLQFGFEQPLLQGAGVNINQILGSFPSSFQYSAIGSRFTSGTGILVARVRYEQQRAEFERRVNHMLLNVEAAYWNLYAAYMDLYGTDQALRMATEVWRVAKEQFPERIDEGDFAGTRAQLQLFRGNRLQAIGKVLTAERNLRLLIGLNVEDGTRIVPIDAPTTAGYIPDWDSSLKETMQRRPELVLAREDIKRRELALKAQLNRLQPDLRFLANYDLVGLGSRLDGSSFYTDFNGDPQTNNAIRSLYGTHYADWTLGMRMTMPLGYRAEFAVVRAARLELAQGHALLKEQELKAQSFLAKQYSRLFELADVVETRRQQRQALADQLDVRFRKFAAGKTPVDFLQSSVSQWATALSAEYRAIVDYNTALATFHFAKGTLMEYDNVNVLESSMPMIAPVRAADHERHRSELLAQRQAARPLFRAPQGTTPGLLPAVPLQEPASLPSLLAKDSGQLPPAPPPPGALAQAAAFEPTPPAIEPAIEVRPPEIRTLTGPPLRARVRVPTAIDEPGSDRPVAEERFPVLTAPLMPSTLLPPEPVED